VTPLRSQIYGVLLAVITAIGCITYEKLVERFSFEAVQLCNLTIYVAVLLVAWIAAPNADHGLVELITSRSHYWAWALFVICYGIVTYLWYVITRNQGVLVGATYEMKYAVALGILYTLFGDKAFNYNTVIGGVCAVLSVYFISRA
jgi:drug/metabolite transporter (DMT)-like permease